MSTMADLSGLPGQLRARLGGAFSQEPRHSCCAMLRHATLRCAVLRWLR